MRIRHPALSFDRHTEPFELLPFRFHRLDGDRVLVSNLVGEHCLLSAGEFDDFMAGAPSLETWRLLAARHVIRTPGDELAIRLLAVKQRTRLRRLKQFTALHIFVVTLRCEHACSYCQVSRQNSTNTRYDMTPQTVERALDLVFRSPADSIKIELQGGEPLLHFDRIREVVEGAERRNATAQRDLAFVIATNLALLDDDILEFAAQHNVSFSTSLDGPSDLHNHSRRRPGADSWQRTIAGIERIREVLGPDRVSALMTTSDASFERGRDIIDCYVEQGFHEIFLRPLSPYGFAARGPRATDNIADWLSFYEQGLDYILDLNRRGISMVETYASIVLTKMLTNDDPGYVDLTSPAGIGIGALVYNYDGDVYASDEGRMLAEMHDHTFRLGNVHSHSYEDLITSDALLEPLEASIALSAPMCSDCAFEPWCGADPVYHHTTQRDFLGRKPSSGFCQRNMGVFKLLVDRYYADRFARDTFRIWAGR
jgi:His-Xaa-Ser system radical SAM maturase HxsB